MPNFDSTKTSLRDLLGQITTGKIQLPDFQRGWVWDDEHIRALLVSIARGFPIGSIMLLETGGEARFQIRPIEGVRLSASSRAERLILDGQQRLTSLTQVLSLTDPVHTQDTRKRAIERYYYFDIEEALQGNGSIEDAIVGVDASRTIRSDFGRKIDLDLGTQAREFESFYFPCSQILNSDHWEEGLLAADAARFPRYMEFRKLVLSRFREYEVPLIELKKENSKEAVCLVFEKVNTGGVPLSVFELVTASYSADGYNLRDDWYGSVERKVPSRAKELAARPLLVGIEATDFLQGIALLHTYRLRKLDLAAGKTGREATAVSAKREQVLSLPLEAYKEWKEPLKESFFLADQFLRAEGFQSVRFLPYRTQLVPLAAILVHLKERWMEPVVRDKLSRWFWCGVFGELYGGAVETRVALDMQGVLEWVLAPDAPEPATVIAAGFQASRLDTLRTRTSAAYRGLYVLLQRSGAKDFFWKVRVQELDQNEYAIDIHHIFPRDWCRANGISDRVSNSIINKAPISYKANRMIGGKAPSAYLRQLRDHDQVRITVAEQNAILESHLIDPEALRADDFEGLYAARRRVLLGLIEETMGKEVIIASAEAPADDVDDEDGDAR
jgi:hypothetical protein